MICLKLFPSREASVSFAQAHFLKWYLAVFDVLSERHVLHAMYNVFLFHIGHPLLVRAVNCHSLRLSPHCSEQRAQARVA